LATTNNDLVHYGPLADLRPHANMAKAKLAFDARLGFNPYETSGCNRGTHAKYQADQTRTQGRVPRCGAWHQVSSRHKGDPQGNVADY
ncbi:MAG TPA: hypothetical protein VFF94_06315, partial [Novosphingobium sp.]|nr:hypothetical protein [Novosphingobium sp.]